MIIKTNYYKVDISKLKINPENIFCSVKHLSVIHILFAELRKIVLEGLEEIITISEYRYRAIFPPHF